VDRKLQEFDLEAMLFQSSIMAGLGAQEVAELAGKLERRVYRRSDVIIRQGDVAGAIHFICSGTVKVTSVNADGKETVLAVMQRGEVFGELGALDGGPRSASIAAMEAVETAALSRGDLLAFIEQHPKFALSVIAILARRLRRLDARLEDAHFLDLDARTARRLLDLAAEHGRETAMGVVIELPLTQSDLAAMVGGTRVSVNRLLGAYQDAGLLELGSRSVTLRDREGLRLRAEGLG
jgi:CRP-like cAMP-binding protein